MNENLSLFLGRVFDHGLNVISGMGLIGLVVFASPTVLAGEQSSNVITFIASELTVSEADIKQKDADLKLNFELNSLPIGAKVVGARLSLVAAENSDGTSSVKVKVCELNNIKTEDVFGSKTVGLIKDHRVNWDLTQTEVINKLKGKVTLCLTNTSRVKSKWYMADPDESNKHPRLILEYDLVDQKTMTQSNSLPAVQSTHSFIPTLNDKVSDKFSYVSRKIPNSSEAYSFTPAFYGDYVYVVTDSSSSRWLQILNALGNPVGNPVGLSRNTGQHLLISKLGRIYIVGEERIFYYQVDHSKSAYRPKENSNNCDPYERVCEVEVAGLQPKKQTPPAVAPDGSLYFVNGAYVYGLNPDMQELWRVSLPVKNRVVSASRVTIGPSGQFVYLNTAVGLIAIDVRTGEVSKNNLEGKETGYTALQAPVVFRMPDGTEKIYAAANSVNSGEMACFNNTGTAKGSNKFELQSCENFKALAGLWGQPLFDQLSPGSSAPNPDKKLYAVQGIDKSGAVQQINWSDGTMNKLQPAFEVGDESYLLDGGNLAIDATGTVFVWNGKGDSGLYMLDSNKPSEHKELPRRFKLEGIPVEARLFFGSDGTLYANAVKTGELFVILPEVTLSRDVTGTIISHHNLRVIGTAGEGTATNLEVAGSVLLGAGFAVKRGAALTIKKPLF